MNPLLFFLGSLLAAPFVFAGPSPEACALRARYLKSAYQNRISFSQLFDQATASGRKIILFGESHFERSGKFYLHAFRELKKRNARLNCVLVEQDKTHFSPPLEACNLDPKGCDRKALPTFSGVAQGFAAGLRVEAIDDPPSFFQLPTDLMADATRRDRYMADATKSLFDSGACTGAVVVVGANHGRGEGREGSLPKFLAERELAPYMIELISPHTNQRGCADYRWIWLDEKERAACSGNPAQLSQNFAFLNTAEGKNVPSGYASIFSKSAAFAAYGKWADYEAVAAIGCENPKSTSCTPVKENCR